MTARVTMAVAAATGLLVAVVAAAALLGADVGVAVTVARLVVDACAVAAIAVPMTAWLAGGSGDLSLRRPALVVAAAWVAAAVVLAWLAAADAAGISPARIGAGTVVDYVTTFAAGTATAITAVFAVVYAVIVVTGSDSLRPTPEVLGVVAVAGLLPGPLAGHAASGPRSELTTVSVAVHAAAAAVWVGGVAAIVVLAAVRRRGVFQAAAPRFSRIATGAVLVVAASGVLTALARLDPVTGLVTTGYGVVVLLKTAVLVGIVLVAARVRRATRAPAALLTAEIVLMAAALGLAAALATAPL